MVAYRPGPKHQEDLDTIAKELKAAAEKYELCAEFYEVIEQINQRLHAPIPVEKPVTKGVFNISIFGIDVIADAESTETYYASFTDLTDDARSALDRAIRLAVTDTFAKAMRKEGVEVSLNNLDWDADFDSLA